MALTWEESIVELHPQHPMRYQDQGTDQYNYSIRTYYDESWGNPHANRRPIILHFHGSGATGFVTPSNTVMNKVIENGWNFISSVYFNIGNSSQNPFRYGYGNVNAPMYMASLIKYAWWVKSTIDKIKKLYPYNDIVLYGHSIGGTAVLAYAAEYMGEGLYSSVKGMVASVLTTGSMGTGTWNDVWRNIGTLGTIAGSITTKDTMIITHADDDLWAPPEYARRLQLSVPEDSPAYFMSAGTGGHQWAATNWHILIEWFRQIIEMDTIRDRIGNRAIPGPVFKGIV